MNPVLHDLLVRSGMDVGDRFVPLHSNMDLEEGRLISQAFAAAAPKTSLEIGCAYGVSTLFACEALAELGGRSRHIVLDPFQSTQWEGFGMMNLTRAGHIGMIELIEERSETALPRLLANGLRIQAAIIDGWHTFDHTLIDFFYVNKMLDVGGIFVLDDTQMPAVQRVAAHIMTYPAYRAIGAVNEPASCVAFQKVAEDDRPWNWFAPF
jgi:cephalosporin hydroxylase